MWGEREGRGGGGAAVVGSEWVPVDGTEDVVRVDSREEEGPPPALGHGADLKREHPLVPPVPGMSE